MQTDINSPKGKLVLRTLAMPNDTNPYGHIFGGWSMSQMDLAGGILAREIAKCRVVTVNASHITFFKPIMVGDIVCCYARCLKTGTTSITIEIEVWVKKIINSAHIQRYCVTNGIFTYVATDQNSHPQPIEKQYQQFDCQKDDMSKLDLSDA